MRETCNKKGNLVNNSIFWILLSILKYYNILDAEHFISHKLLLINEVN